MRGVVAAGHELTAEAGAEALRGGGNAVDAAIACMCASFAAEPLLTGFGAGGYMLVGTPGGEDVLLDFFVEAPGRGLPPGARADLLPVDVCFSDVTQVFNVGPGAVGTYGTAAGIETAHRRYGTLPLTELVAPGVKLARAGVRVNAAQGYIFEILDPILRSTPESDELLGGTGPGDVLPLPEVGDALELLAAEGAAPFYTGDVAAAVCSWVRERGGLLTREDLAAYETIPRAPIRVGYRGRTVLTNPPLSAGGILIAAALLELDGEPGPPPLSRLVSVMEHVQSRRTAAFLEGLSRPGFLDEFLALNLGSTTHISVLDADGWACSVTCTNGEGSGVVVPGTGIHLNNMMGEQDLSPLGFHTHPPGRRLPSMMAPTFVRRPDGGFEVVLGSAGSNRIRSAILQVLSNVIDRGMDVEDAVAAPRVHWEDGITYVEPGIDAGDLEAEGRTVARFRAPNVFFGGCQAVTGDFHGAGDFRRGGAVVAVD